jgi:hypothetical protein
MILHQYSNLSIYIFSIIIISEAGQSAPDNVIICSNTMGLDLDKMSENLSHKEVIKC